MGDYFLELSVNSALSQTNSFDTFLVLPLQTLTRFYHNTKGGNAGQLPEVVILIDGIDAINLIASGTNSGGRDLLSMLCAEIYHLPINVKLIVTGAWDPWIAHKLSSAFHPLSQVLSLDSISFLMTLVWKGRTLFQLNVGNWNAVCRPDIPIAYSLMIKRWKLSTECSSKHVQSLGTVSMHKLMFQQSNRSLRS